MKRTLFLSFLGLLALAATGILATRAEAARSAAQEADGRIVVTSPDGTRIFARAIQLESQDPKRGSFAIAFQSAEEAAAADHSVEADVDGPALPVLLSRALLASSQDQLDQAECVQEAAASTLAQTRQKLETYLKQQAASRDQLGQAERIQKVAADALERARAELELGLGNDVRVRRGPLVVRELAQAQEPEGLAKSWWQVVAKQHTDEGLLERVEALERAARDRGWAAGAGERSLEERVAELERLMSPVTPRAQAPTPAPERREIHLEHTPDGWMTVRERAPGPQVDRAPSAPRARLRRSVEGTTPRAPEAAPIPQPARPPSAPKAPRAEEFESLFYPSRGLAAKTPDDAARARLERALEDLRADAQRLREEMRRLRTEIERLPRDSDR